ncbi:MAG: metal-sensitive transcriptional regulator [Planctomycetota bacterium]
MPPKRVSSKAVSKQVAAAACACGSMSLGPSAKAVRKAVAVDQVIKASNIVRLKRAEGQVRGVARMVEEDRYCADTIAQIAAAQESLRAVAKNLLKNHLTHCAAAALHEDGARRDEMIEELLDLVAKVAR